MKKNIIINCINLFLGLFLSFLFITNIEFNSTVAIIIFPIIVLIIGRISYKKLTEKTKGKIYFYLPSFINGYGFIVVLSVFFIINLLSFFFTFSEELNKERIQRCYSPNKIEYCDVYHYPVGAYSGGTGRVRVFLVNKFIPFMRKEIYYENTAYIAFEEEETSFDYVEWKDNKTIIIPNYQSDILIDVRKIEVNKYILLFTAIAHATVLLVLLIKFAVTKILIRYRKK